MAAAYSLLDRILHRAALQIGPVAEMSFDLDQAGIDCDRDAVAGRQHVFISGLARAGTTILLRRFHASGAFASLTYRNMPFVLAPNIWGRIAKTGHRDIAAAERAHGDRIVVDADSPESLDEVFWRIFDGDAYISRTHLAPHTPDAEITGKFVDYVNAIVKAGGGERYLSKNNNNILRLAAIRDAFPRALILVPFREPLAHAHSLLRQHRTFAEMQAGDRFVRSYMTWLAHHEFGGDHRPFRFDEAGAASLARFSPDEIDYWLDLWRQTYGWLERAAPRDAIFVCYEDLCDEAAVWSRLADIAGIDASGEGAEPLTRGQRTPVETPANARLLDDTAALYGRLVTRARQTLGLPQPAKAPETRRAVA